MFNIDNWQEILNTLGKNKLRTFLTGFSVAWGIFILIILLGSGKGLENGIKTNFSQSPNTIAVVNGFSSLPYKGFKPGRKIVMHLDDFEMIKKLPEVIYATPQSFDYMAVNPITYKNNAAEGQFESCQAGFSVINNHKILEGRDINDQDNIEHRKVVVISRKAKELLFKNEPPIGRYVKTSKGILLLVIGVFESEGRWAKDEVHYLAPYGLAQKLFNKGTVVNNISMLVNIRSLPESELFEQKVRSMLGAKYGFDSKDKGAIWMWNVFEQSMKVKMLFAVISMFLGFIGICTIIAGIVGVTNIMIIAVKERTKEIGIRKAIGAKPSSIIGMIVFESILITSISGYIGLLFGVLIIELVSKFLPASEFFANPEVNINVAVSAVLFLVVTGSIAGFVPARKAARINPIEALRDE
jgi:putative ABC transport system permease protein